MTLPSCDEVEKEISDILPLLAAALNAGNQAFWTDCGAVAHRFNAGTRARMIVDLTGHELRTILDGKLGFHISSDSQTTTLYHKKYVLRTHKLSPENAVAKNDTQAWLDFNDNTLPNNALPDDVMLFPEMKSPPVTLYLGYHENLADRFHPDFYLVCPNGDSPHWTIPLGKGTEPLAPEQLSLAGDSTTEIAVVPKGNPETKTGS